MTPDTSKIMLEEMRHAFDTIHASLQKYNNKALIELGAELTFLMFYISNDEISNIKNIFISPQNGWCVFIILSVIAFITSSVLLIIAITIGRWSIPPHNEMLLDRKQYQQMYEKELIDELITEYDQDIPKCIKKVHTVRILSDIGIYIMIFGIICLLIIKFFSI